MAVRAATTTTARGRRDSVNHEVYRGASRPQIFRRDESRRRCGRNADILRRRRERRRREVRRGRDAFGPGRPAPLRDADISRRRVAATRPATLRLDAALENFSTHTNSFKRPHGSPRRRLVLGDRHSNLFGRGDVVVVRIRRIEVGQSPSSVGIHRDVLREIRLRERDDLCDDQPVRRPT